MTFTIGDVEDDDDDNDVERDVDFEYSPTPLNINPSHPVTEPPEQLDMSIVINAFPDDHFIQESSFLLGDRIVGTVGFCGALALLCSTCCCFCRGFHRQELTSTYNRSTLCGLCCPFV